MTKEEFLALMSNQEITVYDTGCFSYPELAHKLLDYVGDLATQLKAHEDVLSDVNRRFKPKFYHQPWYRGEKDSNGDRVIPNTDDQVKSKLLPVVEYGLDGIVMPVHINYSTTNQSFYIEGGGIENLERVYRFCQEYGIKVRALKFHESYSKTLDETLGTSAFQLQTYTIIKDTCERFADRIDMCTIWNESRYYTLEENIGFFTTMINDIKLLGYRVGLSCAGYYFQGGLYYLPSELINILDFVGANTYARISTKGEDTTVDDSLSAWETHEFHIWKDWLKNNFNKELIITETGIQDYWQCFAQPSNSVWSDMTLSNGQTEFLYYTGLFECLKNSDMPEIWQWFDFNYEPCLSLFKKYLGGERNE